MPTYDYICTDEECGYHIEKNVLVDDRAKQTQEPCPDCGGTIERVFGAPIVNLGFRGSTAQSKAPSDFKEHLQKIKKHAGHRQTGIEL